jgi:hypothetical protein
MGGASLAAEHQPHLRQRAQSSAWTASNFII